MRFDEFKILIAEEAKKAGIDQFELYYTSSESTEIEMFNGEAQNYTAGFTGGVSFRCIVNKKAGVSYTQELSESQARRMVQAALDNALTLEKDEEVFLYEGGGEYENVEKTCMPVLSGEELNKWAKDANDALLKSHEKITDRNQTGVSTDVLEISLMNSNGVDLSWKASIDTLMMAAVVADEKNTNDAYCVKRLDPKDWDLEKFAKETADKAAAKLGADPAPTGAYPVVFSPEAFASLLAVYSAAFSAESVQKGMSALSGKTGEKIAADFITLTDDPFYKENPVRRNFDAEGVPTHKKNIIEKGILKTFLYDLSTAHAEGKKSTGNASRASYASPVAIRPATLVLEPGAVSEEELLKMAGNGVFINSLGGLHAGANPISGDFSLQSAGFMIEQGKKTVPVSSFTVSGNFFELLKQIKALSDKAEIQGAGSLTAFASPCVLAEGLSISGK